MKNLQMYEQAGQYADELKYEDAIAIYTVLSEAGFSDSASKLAEAEANQLKETDYQAAMALMGKKQWNDAIDAFALIEDYHDSKMQIQSCYYEIAKGQYASGKLSEAKASYELAGDYSDAAQKVSTIALEIAYQSAAALEAEGKYDEAIVEYTALGTYSDAATKVVSLNDSVTAYADAQLRESIGDYALAETYYKTAKQYKDAETKVAEMKDWQLYDEAQAYMGNGEYEKAIAIFEGLSGKGFADADEKLEDAESMSVEKALEKNLQMYEQAGQYADERKFEDAIAIYTVLSETGFSDSASKLAEAEANQLKEADYQAALALKEKKQWNDAIDAFTLIEDYHDSKMQIQSCYYEIAKGQHASGKLSEAKASYELAGDYSDAAQKVSEMALEIQYQSAAALEAEGKYDEAIVEYTALGTYSDAAAKAVSLNASITAYADAQLRESIGDYALAETYYNTAKKYKDAETKVAEMKDWQLYDEAQAYMGNGEYKKAIEIFMALSEKGFADSSTLLKAAQVKANEEARKVVASGWAFVAAIGSDGSVKAAGNNKDGQLNVADWSNIVQLDAFNTHLVGLRRNGTVVVAGSNYHGEADVGGWSDVVQVSAGYHHTVALTDQGTVLATGNNVYGQCNVQSWSEIIQVEGGLEHTVGLKKDHTVIGTGKNNDGQLDVDQWVGIIQIDAGKYHTVGLKADGSVVAVGRLCVTGDYPYDMTPVLGWHDIVQLSASDYHTVGLQADGTVVAAGWNKYGQCDVGDWRNIVAVSAGTYNTVGLCRDGTIVIAGSNEDNQMRADEWLSMRLGLSN